MPDMMVQEDMPLILADGDEMIISAESKSELLKYQKDALDIFYGKDSTYLVAVATNKDINKNQLHKIPCKRCLPIGGYVYDATSDTYTISCGDYIVLGFIPFSMYIKISPYYAHRIPMCDVVVRRFLNHSQQNDLANFIATYKPEEFNLHFVQMIDCNG